MAIDGKLMARARERLGQIKANNEKLQEERLLEVYARVPEVRRIDNALRSLMGEVISASLKKGESARREIDAVSEKSLLLCGEKAEALVAAGYAADYLDDVYSCPICRDTGYKNNGDVCRCLMKLYEEEKAAYLSSIPGHEGDSFSAFSLDYYSGADREIMEMTLGVCRSYAIGFGEDSPNLLFRGGTGLGKTFLSGCVAKAVSDKGYSVVYETAGDAFAAFEDRKFSRDISAAEAAGEKVRRILDCELLILDDLGTEMSTAFTHSALYNIVNSRRTSGKKTIISTNLSAAEMAERYTPQVMSRISGEYDTVYFRGRDIRAIKKERRYN